MDCTQREQDESIFLQGGFKTLYCPHHSTQREDGGEEIGERGWLKKGVYSPLALFLKMRVVVVEAAAAAFLKSASPPPPNKIIQKHLVLWFCKTAGSCS